MSTQSVLTTRQLRKIIREEVQGIVEREILKLKISLLPHVSEKEQREIERMFGKKPEKGEIVFEKEIEI
jgi:hypothetical protein